MEPKAREPNLKWKPWTQKLPKKGWILAGKLALDTPTVATAKGGDPTTLMGYRTPNVTKKNDFLLTFFEFCHLFIYLKK